MLTNLVLQIFQKLGIRQCLVLRHGQLQGIITRKDILYHIARLHSQDPSRHHFNWKFQKISKNRLFYYLAIFPNCSLFDNRYSRCIHESYYKFKNNIDLFHVSQPWERLLYEHVTCHVSHVITDSSIFLPSFMLQFAFKVIHEYSDNKNIAISPNHYFLPRNIYIVGHICSGNWFRSKR